MTLTWNTLTFPLSPVPWSLATADDMPVKTDKSSLEEASCESITSSR